MNIYNLNTACLLSKDAKNECFVIEMELVKTVRAETNRKSLVQHL